jgi:release factor glutamine methyltransferase
MAEKKLTTLLEILNYSAGLLKEKDIKDARLNVELMFCELLKCDRIKLYLDFDKPMRPEELSDFKVMLKKRLKHEPLQYILGKTNFYGYTIHLNKNVLIPRQETEILVSKVLDDIYSSEKELINILEIGSGSGCIAIALSGELQKRNIRHKIISIDKSNGAVEIAETNMTLNNITSGKIDFRVVNFLNDELPENDFDYIVSNPPYIPVADFSNLDSEVKDFEPAEALTDGKDGLLFYEKIFNLRKGVFRNSKIFLEIGDGQKNKVENLLSGFEISDYSFYKDYNNIYRVLKIN